ncbi:MAG TPA: DoxX family protein [Gemmataceae bacterium]|nr:DoxX family protein [Gemmataceae bacterium]
MFDHMVKNTVVPLLLRLGLAVIFLYHGTAKVTGEGNELGAAWAKAPEGQQPLPKPFQMAVAWGELLGGAGLAIGFLTRLAALGIAVIMVGAIATVHGPKGFSLQHGGYEYNFLILVVCAAVFLLGAGTLSADRLIGWRRRRAVQAGP